MRYLIVFNDGETKTIEGYDLEDALTFSDLGGRYAVDIISAVKIDD